MGNKIPPRKPLQASLKITARGPTHIGPIGRAKILDPDQLSSAIVRATDRYFGDRDQLFVMLSHYCGLRAKEIAHLWVEDITDVQGKFMNKINISKRGAKYGKERTLPLRAEVRQALIDYVTAADIKDGPIFWTQRGEPMTSNAVQKQIRAVYRSCGFDKRARSHSGRRNFITTLSRKANSVDASLRDVQIMAGHADLSTTATYIDESPHADKLVDLL